MIAKLINWGEYRAQALARLGAALAETHLIGLHTNVAFLRRVVVTRSFAQADLDTALIEREREVLFAPPAMPLQLAAAGVVARQLALEAASETADPWSRRDGWRLHGGARRRLDLEADGAHHAVTVERLHDGASVMSVGEQRATLATTPLGGNRYDIVLAGQRHRLAVYAVGEKVAVFGTMGSRIVGELDLIAHAGDSAGEAGRLTAPMPGKVVSFLAKAGEAISKGQALAVMEAMKMEHTISAPRDGVVAELLFAPGDQVSEGAELLRLAD
jgi:3-methylcrotonyl-CoA carboxylase alpha subunit